MNQINQEGRSKSKSSFGLVLVFIGIAFLLKTFGWLPHFHFRHWWPVFMILLGLFIGIQKWMIQKQGSSTQHNQLESLFQDKIIEGYQHRIVVKDNGMIRIIQAQDMHYVEACDDYIKIFTKDGYHLKKSTLTKLEQTFDPIQFIRVHRSYFIPVAQLLSIEPYEKDGHLALLQCGAKVPVSKSGFSKLKQVLGW